MAFKTAASWLRERFALGSAAAPSITFAGDTNTGLYSPGADQVGIVTAGTARVTIDASGNVSLPSTTSIGSVSATEIGYVDGVTSAIQTQIDAKAPTASPTLTGTPAAPTAAADTNTTQIATTAYVVGQAGTATPAMDSVAATGTSLRFARQDHVHASDTSRAPTASPTFTGVISNALGTVTAPSYTFTGDLNTGVYSPGADQVAVATAGTAILYVVAAGNVGIGTATPSSKLDVSGTITSTALTVGGASVGPSVTVNTQGTAYTLALTDAGKVVEVSNAAAVDVTVPPNGTIAFPVGSRIDILQTGAGQVTIKAGVGVTVNANGGNLKIKGQWAAATVIKRATDTWVAVGNLVA